MTITTLPLAPVDFGPILREGQALLDQLERLVGEMERDPNPAALPIAQSARESWRQSTAGLRHIEAQLDAWEAQGLLGTYLHSMDAREKAQQLRQEHREFRRTAEDLLRTLRRAGRDTTHLERRGTP